MKKLDHFLRYGAACLLVAAGLSSCADSMNEVEQEQLGNEVSAEVLAKFTNLGFNTEGLRKVEGGYLVEGDVVVTPEALAEMGAGVAVPGPAGEEHYRTYNLVSSPSSSPGSRTIKIRGYVSGNLSIGLDYAIANYNAENLCLTFQRIYSGTPDINVYATPGTGGQAGFPSGGDPYRTVFAGNDVANSQQAEHLIAHEIGHCIGFRHTDYFNRSYSCGSGGNEGDAGVGAVYIPQTPILYDPNSIMNACYPADTNGEFSAADKVALSALY